jgi:hypothetical protein
MTIITPTGITGINSITSIANTLAFQSVSGGNVNVSGVNISSGANINISGVSTFASGPVFIGAATSTGTASQPLQVTGGAYVSGNLGVGTTNPGSGIRLDVVGGEIKAGRVDSTNEGGQLSFGRASDNATAWYIDVFGSTSTPSLRVVDVSTASVRAGIDSSGRLLIGTSTSPTGSNGSFSRLVVQGQIPDSTAGGNISIQRGEAAAGGNITAGEGIGNINWSDNAGNTFAVIGCEADANAGANDYPGRLVFSTCADGLGSQTVRVSILNTGELRLGTTENATVGTDPVHTLGSVSIATVQTNVARFVIQDRLSNWISFKTGTGTHHGTIAVSGAGVNYGSNSDYRLKENVEPFAGALLKVQLLKPSTYNYIDYPDTQVSGFIAHELQEVVPEAVCGEKDAVDEEGNPEHQTVDLSKVVPLLTAALQEAISKIEALEAKVAALETL